jgi:hypothetical protein
VGRRSVLPYLGLILVDDLPHQQAEEPDHDGERDQLRS